MGETVGGLKCGLGLLGGGDRRPRPGALIWREGQATQLRELPQLLCDPSGGVAIKYSQLLAPQPLRGTGGVTKAGLEANQARVRLEHREPEGVSRGRWSASVYSFGWVRRLASVSCSTR